MSSLSALTSATTQFYRYTPTPVFILSLIGNIFNLLSRDSSSNAIYKFSRLIYLNIFNRSKIIASTGKNINRNLTFGNGNVINRCCRLFVDLDC